MKPKALSLKLTSPWNNKEHNKPQLTTDETTTNNLKKPRWWSNLALARKKQITNASLTIPAKTLGAAGSEASTPFNDQPTEISMNAKG
jgi:hypothetical protein